MKIGTVDSSGDVLVPLTVEGLGAEGQHRDVTALLDTGFNGFLALPPALISELDLEQISREQYMTAGGAMHFTGVYEAVVVFGEERRVVDEIVEAAEPLVGVGLLWELKVCLEYRGGGEVTIEALGRTSTL
jgi:clan AA aspartic protease